MVAKTHSVPAVHPMPEVDCCPAAHLQEAAVVPGMLVGRRLWRCWILPTDQYGTLTEKVSFSIVCLLHNLTHYSYVAVLPVMDDESLEDEQNNHHQQEKQPNNDLYPFVNKAAPKLEEMHTVGGLNKRLAERHWRVLHRLTNDKVDVIMGKGVKVAQDPYGSKLPSVKETPKGTAAKTAKPSTAPAAAGKRNGPPRTDGSNKIPSAQQQQQSVTEAADTPTPASPGMLKFQKAVGRVTHSMSVVNAAFDYERALPPTEFIQQVDANGKPLSKKQITALTVEAINKRTKETFRESKLAETNVMKLAKEKPYDIQVSNLIQIDLYNRKINLGERDLLEKGLKAEADGDVKSAVICYTRAGSHSKDQHISKMLLGHLHYNKGKLMLALKYYSDAIILLTDRLVHSRIINDEFAAFHNRGS